MFKCKYCDREFERGVQLGGHQVFCPNNPKANESKEKIGNAQRGEKNSMKNPESRKKLTETIKSKIENDSWHLSFSKSRTHEYNGVKLYGKWELEYAKWLDKNEIEWRRPKEKFPYTFNGKKGYYTPDFYLIESKIYIEIKGYPTPKDFAKWDYFPLELEIINGYDLKELDLIKSYKSKNIEYKQYSWK
jgi:hypothetical protein